jgi:AcrR family transcriptional regulator
VDTRSKIVASACSIYLEDGLDSLTMRHVAQHAGLGTMTTYRHFHNKESLLEEIALEGFDVFRGFFYRALEGESPTARLWLCGELYLEFAIQNPRYYEAMFSIATPAARSDQQVTAALQFLSDRISEVRPDTEDPGTAALSLFSHCHGMVALRLAGRYRSDFDFPAFYRKSLHNSLVGSGLVPADSIHVEVQL